MLGWSLKQLFSFVFQGLSPCQAGIWCSNRWVGFPQWGILQRQHTDHAASEGQPDIVDFRHSWGRRWKLSSINYANLICRGCEIYLKCFIFYC